VGVRGICLLTATVVLVIAAGVGIVSVGDHGASGVLSGRMVYAGGTPSIAARHVGVRGSVRFLEDRRVVATVTTSDNGRFEVELPAGEYVIVGSGPTEVACDQLRRCRVLRIACAVEGPAPGNPTVHLGGGEVPSKLVVGCFV